MNPDPVLLITPSVSVWVDGENIIFDRKFYDGVSTYCSLWPGKVRCIFKRSSSNPPDFGRITKTSEELQFECHVLSEGDYYDAQIIKGADIVLASADSEDQLQISDICRGLGIPCIYIIEYTLKTRRDIILLEAWSLKKKLYRLLIEWTIERSRKRAFSLSSGIQANGCPAAYEYRAYKGMHMYFDTRVQEVDLISISSLHDRLAHLLNAEQPLRLAFSGRLERMKGAQYLIPVADSLRQHGLKFELHIFGTGSLIQSIHADIQDMHLGEFVKLWGAVDFHSELIPILRNQIDLFVMPHPQGDPSCTYLETLSCGVPIVGFNNPALSGLLKMAPIGWTVSLGHTEKLTEQIIKLNSMRADISEKSFISREFASAHSFEKVFADRIKHIQTILVESKTGSRL